MAFNFIVGGVIGYGGCHLFMWALNKGLSLIDSEGEA